MRIAGLWHAPTVQGNGNPPRLTGVELRVAAYALIVQDGRVLLPHWNERGHSGWTLPGGGMDPGEDPAATAVREVFEETGYHVELDGLLGVDSIVVAGHERVVPSEHSIQGLRILYRAHVVGGELRDEVDGTTDTARWFDLTEVAGLTRVELVDVALAMAGL
jgi:8-oxo-dGTP diphosphatase